MAPMVEQRDVDEDKVEKSVTVMVLTEWHVDGQAYYAVAAAPMTDRIPGIMT